MLEVKASTTMHQVSKSRKFLDKKFTRVCFLYTKNFDFFFFCFQIEREDFEATVEDGKFIYKLSRKLIDTREPTGVKWIFVLSTSNILYVGMKLKGKFQHSSFLAGGATLSAGRLVVVDGILKACLSI